MNDITAQTSDQPNLNLAEKLSSVLAHASGQRLDGRFGIGRWHTVPATVSQAFMDSDRVRIKRHIAAYTKPIQRVYHGAFVVSR